MPNWGKTPIVMLPRRHYDQAKLLKFRVGYGLRQVYAGLLPDQLREAGAVGHADFLAVIAGIAVAGSGMS